VTYAAKTRENQIAMALGRCAASVKQAGSGHWEFALANGKPLGVSARLFEEWLLLDAPMTDRIARWLVAYAQVECHSSGPEQVCPDAGRSIGSPPRGYSAAGGRRL